MDLYTHLLHKNRDCISHGPAHRGCISHGPAHIHTQTVSVMDLCTHTDCNSHGPAHTHTYCTQIEMHQSWTCTHTHTQSASVMDLLYRPGLGQHKRFPLYTCTMNTSIVSPLIVSSSNTLKKCLAKVKAIKFKITRTVRYWNMVLYNFGRATQRYPLLCHGRFGSMTLPWQVFLQKNLTHIFHRTFSSDIAIFNIHLKKSYNNKKPPSYDFKKKKIISIWHFHTTPISATHSMKLVICHPHLDEHHGVDVFPSGSLQSTEKLDQPRLAAARLPHHNHRDVAPEHTVRQSPGCCIRTHSGTITGMLHLNTQWDNHWDVAPKHSGTITRMLYLNTQWDKHRYVAPEHTVA